ncbi:MAG TPA: tetratricopeptide repeat protein, partial [Longimicrobiaceae bacterium]|nr:tetratricopeptide repeat protein [Longimicrobiaceae bacterium]
MIRIFLSSTFRDLASYRAKVVDTVHGLDYFRCEYMEVFGARNRTVEEFCRERIAQCDVFVGILGHVYGTCPSGSDRSYTEIEYEAAIETGIARLMFLASADASPSDPVSEPAEIEERQRAFRRRVSEGDRVCAVFRSPDDLARLVVQALHHWETGQYPSRNAVLVLPSVVTSHFTARDEEIARLERTMLHGRLGQVVGLWGSPGVGKSTLAKWFGEEYAARFPGGVVALDLRGKDVGQTALDFADLIGERVDPEKEWNPSTIMQSRFSRRKALVILDNVEQPDVRHLLPGGQCSVIVTTRDREILDHLGLSAENQIEISPFVDDEALSFLQKLLGEQVIEAEIDDARRLSSLVGGLPLALRVAGASIKSQFLLASPVAQYVAELQHEENRLRHLQWRGMAEMSVEAVFGISRAHLNAAEREAFACLAACMETGFGLEAASAVVDGSEATAAQHLSRLVNLALLNYNIQSERYHFHPLLHLFARNEAEVAGLWDTAQRRHATYFTTFVRERHGYQREVLNELEAEQEAILHVAWWKLEHHDLDVQFWHGLRQLLHSHGFWEEGIRLMTAYLSLAEMQAEDAVAAHFHLQIGKYRFLLGHLDEAVRHFERSLAIVGTVGDERSIAMVLNSLGGALQAKGRFDDAVQHFERSLAIREQLGDERSIAMLLNSLGGALQAKGHFDDAVQHFERSLAILEKLGDERGAAMVLNSLAMAYQRSGNYALAAEAIERCIRLEEKIGNAPGVLQALTTLASLWQRMDRLEDAAQALEKLVDAESSVSNRRGEAKTLTILGLTYRRLGRHSEALAALERALDINLKIRDRRGQAIVRLNLATLYSSRSKL